MGSLDMLRPSQPPTRRIDNSRAGAKSILSRRQLGPSFQVGGEGRLRLQVAFGFFVIAGAPGIAGGASRVALYAAIAFFALLAHELGHALCGVLWGSQATIVLHLLGGHTKLEPRLPRWRDVVAMLMGPCFSILIALMLAMLRHSFPRPSWLTIALWVNFVWGIVNLLPMLPFDGGRVLLAILRDEHRSGALLVSGAFALVLSVEALFVLHNAAMLLVFGPAAFASLLAWAKRRRIDIEQKLGLADQLQQARGLLLNGEPERSRQLGTRVAQRARTNTTANAAWEIVAWAELGLGRAAEAYETLCRVRPASDVDRYSLAAVEAARGQPRRAVSLLEAAQSQDALCADGIKLLIDLHARLGSLAGACAVASAEIAHLDPEDTRRVIEAAFEAEALASATTLAGELFAMTGSPDDAVSQAYGLARLGDRMGARRIFRHLATLLSSWQMHAKTLARLRDLAARPDSRDIIGPELSHLVLAHAP
jgi:Zn-dependent protease